MQLRVIVLETTHDLGDVLDIRRRGEAMADQLAPFLEIGRAAEIDRVVLQRLPLQKQPALTPASKSFSMPGLTSIWAISVIMIVVSGWRERHYECSAARRKGGPWPTPRSAKTPASGAAPNS
jgi:hypothetical protein